MSQTLPGDTAESTWPMLRYIAYVICRVNNTTNDGSYLTGPVNFVHKGKYGEKIWQQSGFHGRFDMRRFPDGGWHLQTLHFSWCGPEGFPRLLRCTPMSQVVDSQMYANMSLAFHQDPLGTVVGHRAWAITYLTRSKSDSGSFMRWVTALPLTGQIPQQVQELTRSRL